MDDPALLGPEWERKNVLPALRDLYDEIWVYGLPQICTIRSPAWRCPNPCGAR